MSKIDFVVLWVDGSDEDWLNTRLKYSKKEYVDPNQGVDTVISQDYRDWNLLKYWFRSIEEYAPWVNKIHFVTFGHLPKFLNLSHPKLNIVKHDDFIPKEYLPTFSSHTIELNLHRIDGLSDCFVYFNDDMYLNNYVQPDDFFINGLPRDTAIINPAAPSRFDSISTLMINNAGVINQNFDKTSLIRKNFRKWFNFKYGVLNILNIIFLPWKKFPGFLEQHLPTSFKKQTYVEVWSKEYEILNNTCMNKVRDFKTDINQWLLKEWQISKGEFIPRSYKFGDRYLVDSLEKAREAAKAIENKKLKMICINDHYDGDDLDEIIKLLQEAFKNELSEKSSYEI